MNRRFLQCTACCLLLAGFSTVTAEAQSSALPMSNRVQLPLLANQGELDPQVAFYSDASLGRYFITVDGQLVYRLRSAGDAELVLYEALVDAAPSSPQGLRRSEALVSRFAGHYPAASAGRVPAFDTVGLGEVYPGIELELVAREHSLEKFFIVAPAADPAQIQLALSGAEQARIDAHGRLLLQTELGEVAFSAPVAWQTMGAGRQPVKVAYQLRAAVDGQIRYGFELGSYDTSEPLLIDPLLATTSLGGTGGSGGENITALLLADGALFAAGTTSASDFPTTPGVVVPTRPTGSKVGFVARLSTDLSTLQAATYIGGALEDPKLDVRSGSLYVAVNARDANFPTTAFAFDSSYNGGTLGDLAVARFSLDLSQFQGGTYLGSAGNERLFDLATHAGVTDAMACVSGYSSSAAYPITPGAFDTTHNGNVDAVVSCLSLDLSQLLGSTFISGSGNALESAVALAMMPDGALFRGIAVAGTTTSGGLPGMNGVQTTPGGSEESFIYRFTSSALDTVAAATYLGGSAEDLVEDIAWNPSLDALFVAGRTRSLANPGRFPVTLTALQPTGAAEWDMFATRLPIALNTLQGSTFLGGDGVDEVGGILTSADQLIILGLSSSTDMPTSSNAYAQAPIGAVGNDPLRFEGFIASLDGALSALTYGSYYSEYQNAIFQGSVVAENRPQASVSVFDNVPALQLARDAGSGTIYLPFLHGNPTPGAFQNELDNPVIVRMNLSAPVAELQASPAFQTVSESAGQIMIGGSRGGAVEGFSRAIFARQSGGSAQAGDDFQAPGLPSIRIWQPGVGNSFQIPLQIIDDDVQEAPNEVAFFGYNDDILGANLAASSFQVQLVIVDDDQAGIEVDAASLPVTEGQTALLGIVLTSSPPPGSESVNVRFRSSDENLATIAGADATGVRTFSYSADNWNQPQMAQINAVDDAMVNGNRPFEVEFLNVFHSDPFLNGLTRAAVPGLVIDDDSAGLHNNLSAQQTTSEADAGSNTLVAQLRLDSEPSAAVTVQLSLGPGAAGEGSLVGTELSFDASDWNLLKNVRIAPLDDTVADGNRSYSLLASSSSSDPNYQQPTPVQVAQITNLDDEMAQIDLAVLIDSGQPSGFVPPAQVYGSTVLAISNQGPLDVAHVSAALSASNAQIQAWNCQPAPGSGAATLCQSAGGSGPFSDLLLNIGQGETILVSVDVLPTGSLGATLTLTGSAMTPAGVADPDGGNNQSSYTLVIANGASIFADGFE